MTKPELTLKNIKQSPKMTERVARVSDFLSKDEVKDLHRSNAIGRRKKRKFDDLDAMEAEIIARFGYEVYLEWEAGHIKTSKMTKWVLAERARCASEMIGLKAILANGFAGCATPTKNGQASKPIKGMRKIMKQEIKIARGEQ